MKVAVLSVIYPGVEEFLGDFLASLSEQTFAAFRLFLVNDGLERFVDVEERHDLDIEEIKYCGTIAKVREFGINVIRREGYDCLVFADADDFFFLQQNRELIKAPRIS